MVSRRAFFGSFMSAKRTMKTSFEDRYIPEPNSGCWIWLGKMFSGYGQMGHRFAHRVSFEKHKGSIPRGIYVCHSCDVKICVNPDHLFLGTQKVNLQDMASKGRGVGNSKTPGHLRCKAKLTPEKVIEIRASTDGTCALAAKYGVHRQTILRVRTRESYSAI